MGGQRSHTNRPVQFELGVHQDHCIKSSVVCAYGLPSSQGEGEGGWAVCVLTPHQGYKTHPDILTPWDLLDSQIT